MDLTSPPTQTGPPGSSFNSPMPGLMYMDQNTVQLSTKREREKLTPMYNVQRFTQTVPALWKNKTSRRFAHEAPKLVTYTESDDDKLQQMLMDTTHVYNPENRKTSFFEQCFRIEQKIGEGSFGEVVRAVSLDDGKAYAVKIAKAPYRSKADRELKLREVYKHEKLPKHNNLVEFIKAWEERGQLFIQTELCDQSLFDFIIRKHELSQQMMWTVFTDVLMAIDVLHQRNLIHLDIKPANIFMTNTATKSLFKLGDFGLIFDLSHDSMHSFTEGDSMYLAPELLNNHPTKAADIFSFGMSLLEAGSDLDLPSQGIHWHNIRRRNIPDKHWAALEPEMRALVFSMLDSNPTNRPTTSELMERFNGKLVFRRFEQNLITKRQAIWAHLHNAYLYVLAFLHCCLIAPFIAAKNAIAKKKKEIIAATSPYSKHEEESKTQTTPDPTPRLCLPRQIHFDHDESDDEYDHDYRKRKFFIKPETDDTDTAGSSSSEHRSSVPKLARNATPSPEQNPVLETTPMFKNSPFHNKKNLDASGDWGKVSNYSPHRISFEDDDLEEDCFSLPHTSLSAPNSLRERVRVPIRQMVLKSPIPKLDFTLFDEPS